MSTSFSKHNFFPPSLLLLSSSLPLPTPPSLPLTTPPSHYPCLYPWDSSSLLISFNFPYLYLRLLAALSIAPLII